MLLDKEMTAKCKYEWEKGAKMTKDKPLVLSDKDEGEMMIPMRAEE